jgi:hypothetical protein
VFDAPIIFGLLDRKKDVPVGAKPPFLSPPHVGKAVIDDVCLARVPALIKTILIIIYTSIIIFLLIKKMILINILNNNQTQPYINNT